MLGRNARGMVGIVNIKVQYGVLGGEFSINSTGMDAHCRKGQERHILPLHLSVRSSFDIPKAIEDCKLKS